MLGALSSGPLHRAQISFAAMWAGESAFMVSLAVVAYGEGGVTAYVGGVTAANVDLASKISSKLAELILVVLALSIVLLLIAFRSLLIPVQAAVTNLLCVGAAFGISYLFERRSVAYILINGGYMTVTLTLMGLIIGGWR